MAELSVERLKRVLDLAGITLTSDLVQRLLDDPDVKFVIDAGFLDALYKEMIDTGVLDPQSLSDQELWEIAKRYLLEQGTGG